MNWSDCFRIYWI